MMLIRAGGFIAACTIHGLFLSMQPLPPEVKNNRLDSTNSNLGKITTLSVSHMAAPKQIVTPYLANTKPHLDKPTFAQTIIEKNEAIATNVTKKTLNTVPKIPPSAKSLFKTVNAPEQPNQVLKPKNSMFESISNQNIQTVKETIITQPLFAKVPMPPPYPRLAQKRRQEGTVWIDILLDESGRQKNTKIYQSSGILLLDRSALNAVTKWQFIAHHINDIAVPSHIRIPVEFSLE